MKKYEVTVVLLMFNGEIFHEQTFCIMARSREDAEALVYNRMVFSHEPNFKITGVEEVEES